MEGSDYAGGDGGRWKSLGEVGDGGGGLKERKAKGETEGRSFSTADN